jgi:4-hydroxyacetophenone monooxygenase
MLTAYRLKQAGIPHVVLERHYDVGGTWLAQRYPGAGVDTELLVQFSFFHRDWSSYFSQQEEVLDYIRDFVDHFDLRPSVRFGAEVTSARYDEARQTWLVAYSDRDGSAHQIEANAVVSAVGIFGVPSVPDVRGIDRFQADLFHSAHWPTDFDLHGRRVGVVGNGATAMQVVPAIADQVETLTIFQRTPMWVTPSDQFGKPVSSHVHWLINHAPFYRE